LPPTWPHHLRAALGAGIMSKHDHMTRPLLSFGAQ
jgi:hypothetical protein